ncbi:lysophospholipase, putative [Plasmodium vivax]|nr:lysophospholipase, putative [Plasmodium vivax]
MVERDSYITAENITRTKFDETSTQFDEASTQFDEAVERINGTSVRLDGAPTLDSFYNKDGLLLRTYGWLVKNAIGIIILIHGLNSHVRFSFLRHNVDIVNYDKALLKDENNYYVYKDSWIEHFNKCGYSVYGIDLQGHGQSEGWGNLKVNVKQYDDLVYDVMQYIHEIHDKVSSYGDKSGDSSSSGDERCEEVPTVSNRNRGTFLSVKEAGEESEPSGKNKGKSSSGKKCDKSSSDKKSDKSSNAKKIDKSSSGKKSDKSLIVQKSDKSSSSKKDYRSSTSQLSDDCSSKHSDGSSSQISDKSPTKRKTNKLLSIADAGGEMIFKKKKKKKALPTYIIGQSMGGNIALRTLQLLGKSNDERNKRLNIKGCISLSGMISIELMAASPRSYKYSCFYLPFFKLFSCFFPRYRLINNMRYIRYKYMNDVARFDKIRYKKGITSRFGYELLKAMKILDRDMIYIPKDIPILFIHSKDDTLCYYRGVVSFFNRLKNDNKELHILENMEHMLTIEPGNENVLKKILTWLTNLPNAIRDTKWNFEERGL